MTDPKIQQSSSNQPEQPKDTGELSHGEPIQTDSFPQVAFQEPPQQNTFQEPPPQPEQSPLSPPPGGPTIGGGEMENPFVPPSAPPTPARGLALRKILAVVVLLAAIIAVVFFIFSLFRRVIGKKSEPITLTYWGLWEEESVMQKLIDQYESDHPGVTITYVKESPRQYRERLQTSINNGTGPDIFRFHNTWVPMLQNELAAAPEEVLPLTEFNQAFYPVAQSDLVVNGKILGVPLEIDGLGLYYNEELLRSAGVTPPQTWEALQDAAQKIAVRNKNGALITAGIALGTANNVEHFSDILAVMMLQNGADLKSPTSAEAHEALSFYRLFAEPPNNVWDSTQDNSILAFANEKVGMIIAPSWQAHTIIEINPQLRFKVIALPQLPGANIAWASYWAEGVSSANSNQEEAWKFLAFLSSKDAVTRLYTEAAKERSFGEPYARTDLAQDLINDPYVGAYVQQAPIARSFFVASKTFDNGINDRMIKYMEDAINSLDLGVSPAEAVATMSQGFSQVLKSFGSQ